MSSWRQDEGSPSSAESDNPYSPTGAFIRPVRSSVGSPVDSQAISREREQQGQQLLAEGQGDEEFEGLEEAFASQDRRLHSRLLHQIRNAHANMVSRVTDLQQRLAKETANDRSPRRDEEASASIETFSGVEADDLTGMQALDEVTKKLLLTVHEEPHKVLESILGNNRENPPKGKLQQVVLEKLSKREQVVHWSSRETDKSSYDMVLRLKVVKTERKEVTVVRFNSVDKGDFKASWSDLMEGGHPHRMIINEGFMKLFPEKYGQTALIFCGKVYVQQSTPSNDRQGDRYTLRSTNNNNFVDGVTNKIASMKSAVTANPEDEEAEVPHEIINHNEVNKASRVADSSTFKRFNTLGLMLYERFKNEDLIDEKMKEDFLAHEMESAPVETDQSRALIERSLVLLKEMDSAKRVAAPVSDRVEKFTLWKEGEPSAWGKTVCSVDTSAKKMFAHLRVLNTYKRKRDHIRSNGSLPRGVWENINGTRILQFSTGVKFPSGFHNRLFETWLTWEKRKTDDGKDLFIMAFAPLSEYHGPRYKVSGSQDMTQGLIRGIHVVKEVTADTCEWLKVQNVDLQMALPKVMLDYMAKNELNLTHMIQESFRRNGKLVDQELRQATSATMQSMRGLELAKDQQVMFNRCQQLGRDESWNVTESPYEDVDLWMKEVKKGKGNKGMVIGRVKGIVDCSAEEMASWVMDFCSNERVRFSVRQGKEIARYMLLDKQKPNENTAAVVKRTALFLKNQEFVVRQIWKSEVDCVTLALESCDDSVSVDYGFKANSTKGFTQGYWKIARLPDRGGAAQCEASLYMLVNDNRTIPSWLVKRKPPATLGAVQGAIDVFRKDELVDDADRVELADFIRRKHTQQQYSAEETEMINRVKDTFEGLAGKEKRGRCWGELISPDLFVKMEYNIEEESMLRGSTIVDDTIEDCAAWEMKKMTRERNRGYRSFGGLERHLLKVNDHSEIYHAVYDTGVRSFVPREWLMKIVWKQQKDDLLYVMYEDTEHPDFPINETYHVRVRTRMFWKYERLATKEGKPQTKVTYYQQLDMRGIMPKSLQNSRAVGTLAILMGMRKKFDKSDDIDQSRRSNLAEMIRKLPKRDWKKELEYLDALSSKRKNATKPLHTFGLSKSTKIATRILGGIGWGVTRIDMKASLEEAAAFFFDFNSRASQEIANDIERMAKKHQEDEGCLKSMLKRRVKLRRSKRTGLAQERKFFNQMVVHKIDSDNILVTMLPVTEKQFKEWGEEDLKVETISKGWRHNRGNKQRGRSFLSSSLPIDKDKDYEGRAATSKAKYCIKLHRRSEGVTAVDFFVEVELGTTKSSIITKFVKSCLDEVAATSIYFQRRVNLRDMDASDGEALGHDLMWKANTTKDRLMRFEEVLKRSQALKQVVSTVRPFSWFPITIREILKGELYLNHPIDTKMVCLNDDEAGQIGRNLIPALRSKKKIEAGIDQWRVQNRAAKEFLEHNPWFQTTLKVVSKGVVRTAPWGLFWRVIVGAVLSMLDLLTDVNVAHAYHSDGRLLYRNLVCLSISVSMFLQMILVISQHKHQGLLRVLRETFWVLTGLKTTSDAIRVATAQKKEEGSTMDPLEEMTYSKCIEIFAEAIPGILIQMKSVLEIPDSGAVSQDFFGSQNVSLLVSIIISALSVGFTSGQISYDYDTDPERRAKSPGFFGFIPDSKNRRTFLFCTMVLTPSFMVLIKCMAITLLFLFDPVVLAVYYWAFEISIFLFVKWLRDDLELWIPMTGVSRRFLTLFIRIACKILTDFTGIIQLRHPLDLGGLTWTISSFISLLSLFAAIQLHADGEILFPDIGLVWTVCWTLCGLYVFGFCVFFALINKGYAKTFWSVATGPEYLHDKFISHPSDETRADIFNISPLLWKHMRLEVKAWVGSHWEGWTEVKPGWLTDEVMAMIPEDFVPSEEERLRVRKLRLMLEVQRQMMDSIEEGDEEDEDMDSDDDREARSSSRASLRSMDHNYSKMGLTNRFSRRMSSVFGGGTEAFNILANEAGGGGKPNFTGLRKGSTTGLRKGSVMPKKRSTTGLRKGSNFLRTKHAGGERSIMPTFGDRTSTQEGGMIVPTHSGLFRGRVEQEFDVKDIMEEGDWELMEELQQSIMRKKNPSINI